MSSIYLNQPSDYSGDIWHVAAAMTLNSNIILVLTVPTRIKDAKERAKQAKKFYNDIGIKNSRIIEAPTNEDLVNGKDRSTIKGKTSYVKKNQNIAQKRINNFEESREKVHWIYSSTSIIMKSIEKMGVSFVQKRLAEAFTREFNHNFKEAKQVIDKKVDEIPKDALLINGRFATYKKEHNVNTNFWKIIKSVKESSSLANECPIIMIADKQNSKNESINESQNYCEKWIDIYNLHESLKNIENTKFINMQGTAYFWKKVSERKDILGVIGGRSGSLDIAAFMGVRTLSWDKVSVDDPECIRHMISAPSLLSIMHWDNSNEQTDKRVLRHETMAGTPIAENNSTAHEIVKYFLGENSKPFCPKIDLGGIQRQITIPGMEPNKGFGNIYEVG